MAEKETQKFNKNHLFIKNTLQLLVSISALSLFISYSSELSHFLHHYSYQLSAMLFPVLGQTLERKYMFLICNGIVAFLSKNFSFKGYSPSGPFSTTDTLVKSSEHGMMETAMETKSRAMIKEIEDDDADEGRVETGCLIPSFSEQAGGNEANMSADELKRKFDEFIRKMKEEIRIGAQLQPIAV